MRVRRRPADEIGLQIAPMCDVVFLILTFFMLTTELAKQSPARLPPVRLPLAAAAGVDAETGRFVVSIDAQGRFLVDGREAAPEALRAALADRAQHHAPLRVRLRADAAAPARAVKEAVGWSAAAGAEEVVIGAVSASAGAETGR